MEDEAEAKPDGERGPGAGVVRVETVELDARGGRQIGSRTRASSPLDDRAEEIRQAIVQASALAQDSLVQVPERGGWSVNSVEVTFGLTLAAEAGVILSKASAEASLEVTLTVERGAESMPRQPGADRAP